MEKELPVSRAFFYIFLGLPSKHGLLIKQNIILLSKSLVNEPTSRFPTGAPMEGEALFQNLPFTYASGSPVREPSLQVFLAELP
jgi:hypothetical protein